MRRLVSIAAALVAVAVLGVAGFTIYAASRPLPKQPVETTPAEFGIAFENVEFPAPDIPITLRGWWVPATGAARAVIVLVHGGGANRVERCCRGIEFTGRLAAAGYHVLALDLRNHGESDSTPTGRLTLGFDEANDIIGAIDFIETKAPGLPVVGVGTSMGGATLFFAGVKDKRLKAIVGLDPLLDNWTAVERWFAAGTGLPWPATALYAWSGDALFGTPITRVDPLAAAAALEVPVLVIQNEADPICPIATVKELAQRNPRVRLVLTPPPTAPELIAATNGGFGTHAKAFVLDPDGTIAKISAFIDEAVARDFAPAPAVPHGPVTSE